MKKILANTVYSDTTLKSWTKEQLIEQIRILENNWSSAEEKLNNSAKNSEKLFAEQKAEIEQLTEQNKALAVVIDSCKNGSYSSSEIINALTNFYRPVVEEERAREKEIFEKLFGFVKNLCGEYGVEVK